MPKITRLPNTARADRPISYTGSGKVFVINSPTDFSAERHLRKETLSGDRILRCNAKQDQGLYTPPYLSGTENDLHDSAHGHVLSLISLEDRVVEDSYP
jgi:hypothetical protein